MQCRTSLIILRVSLLLLIALAACRTTKPSESDLTWGYLGNITPHNLIRQPSGTIIKVCGLYSVQTTWAIQVWAAYINRRLIVVQSCDHPHIVTQSATLEPLLNEECIRRGNTSGLFADPYNHPMRIAMCNTTALNSSDIQAAILHEVGHLWGMCDQYRIQDGLKTCAYTTEPVEGSVMNINPPLYLTADDIAGIQNLASIYPDAASASAPSTATLPPNNHQRYAIETPSMGSQLQKFVVSAATGRPEVQIHVKDNTLSQTWDIVKTAPDSYHAIKSHDHRCLDINPGTPEKAVVLQICGNYLGQKWLFEKTSIPAYFRIKNLFTGVDQCLTVVKTSLAMQPCDANKSVQLWNIHTH